MGGVSQGAILFGREFQGTPYSLALNLSQVARKGTGFLTAEDVQAMADDEEQASPCQTRCFFLVKASEREHLQSSTLLGT